MQIHRRTDLILLEPPTKISPNGDFLLIVIIEHPESGLLVKKVNLEWGKKRDSQADQAITLPIKQFFTILLLLHYFIIIILYFFYSAEKENSLASCGLECLVVPVDGSEKKMHFSCFGGGEAG